MELRSLQSSQATRLEQEARSDANAAIASQVTDLVNEVDGDGIGDAVPEAFDQIIKDLDPTTTTVIRMFRDQTTGRKLFNII